MDIRHPDVLEFVQAKREDGRLRQFNLSLLITGDFIEAVKADRDWQLIFPLNKKEVEQDKTDLTTSDIVWADWPTKEGVVINEQGLVACKVYKSNAGAPVVERHHDLYL